MVTGFFLPPTISSEARRFFEETFSRDARDAERFPAPSDIAGWNARSDAAVAEMADANRALVERYRPQISETKIGGVRVLDIRPCDWCDDGSVLVHAHGGGYVNGTADASLDSALPLCSETGRRIVSVDYTIAPKARFPQAIDEVVAVIKGLCDADQDLGRIGLYGDSAGASLAAAAALKLRDEGIGLVGAAVLWSPWADITETGDTYLTLSREEPCYLYATFLKAAAEAYADPVDHRHPYVSPVYADFAPGYPPTLVQVGTREILLSAAVRLYRAIDDAGGEAVLDVYEGMWHAFHFRPIDMPEAQRARAKTAAFFARHLGR